MDPEQTHRLLTTITDFLVDWIAYQRELSPSIDGIRVNDWLGAKPPRYSVV